MDRDRGARYPLVTFRNTEAAQRRNRGGGATRMSFPTFARQRQRLTPQFQQLQGQFRAAVQDAPQGVDPDLVLVLEISGKIADFVRAARCVDGLEWIGEWGAPDLEPDADFHTEKEGESVRNSLFLMFSNQAALKQMLGLWRLYGRDQNAKFPRGLALWKDVFRQLRNIRVWSAADRITPGLVEDWQERREAGAETIPFEVELWYFHEPAKRELAENAVRRVVEVGNGKVINRTVIDEIEYHALIGEMPAWAALNLAGDPAVRLFNSREIMYIRPAGQAFERAALPDENAFAPEVARDLPDMSLPPVLAILDGLPIENHPLLAGRVLIDDPDGWAAEIPVADRVHGTSIASLVLHGDLAGNDPPLTRPVYIRPVLRPEGPDWVRDRREAIPEGELFTDVIHKAIRRLFEERAAVGGRIFIVNLSVGDKARLFDRSMSPCARLLDWLAWKYQVLILVSAGNHTSDIRLEMARGSLLGCTPEVLTKDIIRSLDRDGINRRLLSPAESVNAITVAALHEDSSGDGDDANSVLAHGYSVPSPYNAQGFGYRRAIKPDLLFPGGRIRIRENVPNGLPEAVVEMIASTREPGQCVATAPRGAVHGSTVCYSQGTSNACAIGSRAAAIIFETLSDGARIDKAVPEEFTSLALKTMLVHGAEWGDLGARYEGALDIPARTSARDYIAKYVGNGTGDVLRSTTCASNRITVLGWGSLPDGNANIYSFPLPPSLSANACERSLVVTLSWITPINTRHYNYRRAHLWFSFPEDDSAPRLVVPPGRVQVHAVASTRGTVQHEVFSGADARPFRNGDQLRIWVNCRADAGVLDEPVPYVLAVSLGVPLGVNLPIYQEISERIRQGVVVRPRP